MESRTVFIVGTMKSSSMEETIKMPYDRMAENIVLAQVLNNTYGYSTIAPIIGTGEVFYSPVPKKVWSAILSCIKVGKSTDIIMVAEELKRLYPSDATNFSLELTKICDCYEPLPEIIEKAHYLVALSQKRKLLELSMAIKSFVLGGDLECGAFVNQLQENLQEVLQSGAMSGVKAVCEVLDELHANIDANINGTGIKPIVLFPGVEVHEGELVVVAAESSMGKTSFALNCAVNAASSNTPVAVFSLEMKSLLLAGRIISSYSGVSSSRILYSPLSNSELKKVDPAIGDVYNLPIFFDDKSSISFDSILASIRMMKMKYGIKIVVVDYLQILPLNGVRNSQTEEQKLGEFSRRLKNLALELGICIIALSQLSRDKDNPYPSVNRLRGSGQILEACDQSIMIYRPEAVENGRNNFYPEDFKDVDPHGTALIILGKNRNGSKSKFICGFNAELTAFYPLEYNEIPTLNPITIKKPGSIV